MERKEPPTQHTGDVTEPATRHAAKPRREGPEYGMRFGPPDFRIADLRLFMGVEERPLSCIHYILYVS